MPASEQYNLMMGGSEEMIEEHSNNERWDGVQDAKDKLPVRVLFDWE